jgi:D-alanine-D-alanine ligase-like ATP-grasp enzyme
MALTTRKLRVALIFGGRSCEHEVSLASALSVMAYLDPGKYEVLPIAISREGVWSKCSDLTEWVCLGQQSHTLREGIEPLSHPGAKEAGQTHASR